LYQIRCGDKNNPFWRRTMEDSYLDASYEDRTEPLYEECDYDDDRDYPEEDESDYDESDYEEDMDHLLAQQELEDFEQADEHFNGGDYSDYE